MDEQTKFKTTYNFKLREQLIWFLLAMLDASICFVCPVHQTPMEYKVRFWGSHVAFADRITERYAETSLSLCVVEARARVGCMGCVNSEPPSLFWAYCGFTMHISTWKNLEASFCQYVPFNHEAEDQYHEQMYSTQQNKSGRYDGPAGRAMAILSVCT